MDRTPGSLSRGSVCCCDTRNRSGSSGHWARGDRGHAVTALTGASEYPRGGYRQVQRGATRSSTGAIMLVSIPDWDDRCHVSHLASFASRSDEVAGSERKCGRNCRLTNLRRAPEEDFFSAAALPRVLDVG